MSWIHTGGGWYENEEGERIRGKANLPSEDGTDAEISSKPSGRMLPCLTCNEGTSHTQQPVNSPDWGIYNCDKCGGKTRVSLK